MSPWILELKQIPFIIAQKNEIFKYKSIKHIQDLYTKNYKTLRKLFKDNINGNRIMFMDW